MKSFHSFITERRAKNFGTKGGQGGTQSTSNTPLNKRESRANMQDPNRSQRGGKPNPVRGRRTPVNIPSQSGDLITNFKADAKITPEEQFQRLLDKATKDASGERVGQQATHPVDAETTRQSGRERTGGRVKGDRPVGTQKPRTRFVPGQGYTIPTRGTRATRILGGTGTKTGSLSKGTLTFSGDAKYRRLLRRLTTDVKPLPSGTGVRKEFKPEIKTEPTSKPRVVKSADTLPKPPKPPKPTTYRNLGIGPETAGRSLNIKGVRASAPVRAPRPQRYSNLGLGQERAGQRVVNRPVEIRVKSQPKTQLPKPPVSSKVVADKVVQQMQDAAKKKAASNVRTLGRIGKGLGVVGAGLEAQGEYMRRKEDLKQDTATAVTGAATRTGGGLTGAALGGKFGAKLGSVFGPKGALVGGAAGSIYGYMVGADKATQGFDALTKGAKNFDPVSFTNFRKRTQSASK